MIIQLRIIKCTILGDSHPHWIIAKFKFNRQKIYLHMHLILPGDMVGDLFKWLLLGGFLINICTSNTQFVQ